MQPAGRVSWLLPLLAIGSGRAQEIDLTPRISQLSIRIPAGVSYKLEAFPHSECFRWINTDEEVLELTSSSDPFETVGKCTRSAIVTSRDVAGSTQARVIAKGIDGEFSAAPRFTVLL
eukprot:SAG11_NODE_270_length_11380_cov_10.415034_2_plen_118_part_00